MGMTPNEVLAREIVESLPTRPLNSPFHFSLNELVELIQAALDARDAAHKAAMKKVWSKILASQIDLKLCPERCDVGFAIQRLEEALALLDSQTTRNVVPSAGGCSTASSQEE